MGIEDAAATLAAQGNIGDAVPAAVPLITAMAKAYTRGRGFDDDGDPSEEIAAVITTASVRLAANTRQTDHAQTMGEFSETVRSFFNGWTLAELAVLNRYRVRAM
ncbi:MAG: hypothetical protein KDB71_07120 [Mycobacterium sp.]|nr:hypothetical protein [Mycobacterium sp.]